MPSIDHQPEALSEAVALSRRLHAALVVGPPGHAGRRHRLGRGRPVRQPPPHRGRPRGGQDRARQGPRHLPRRPAVPRSRAHPDLLPSDITGVTVFSPETGTWEFRPGPVFGHVVLLDEMNRTPPRTQSALLEAMEEQQVSVDGESWPLPRPAPRHRHPEPGGPARHLPAGREPARPIRPVHHHRLPRRRRPRHSSCCIRAAATRSASSSPVTEPAQWAEGHRDHGVGAGGHRGGRVRRGPRAGHARRPAPCGLGRARGRPSRCSGRRRPMPFSTVAPMSLPPTSRPWPSRLWPTAWSATAAVPKAPHLVSRVVGETPVPLT